MSAFRSPTRGRCCRSHTYRCCLPLLHIRYLGSTVAACAASTLEAYLTRPTFNENTVEFDFTGCAADGLRGIHPQRLGGGGPISGRWSWWFLPAGPSQKRQLLKAPDAPRPTAGCQAHVMWALFFYAKYGFRPLCSKHFQLFILNKWRRTICSPSAYTKAVSITIISTKPSISPPVAKVSCPWR